MDLWVGVDVTGVGRTCVAKLVVTQPGIALFRLGVRCDVGGPGGGGFDLYSLFFGLVIVLFGVLSPYFVFRLVWWPCGQVRFWAGNGGRCFFVSSWNVGVFVFVGEFGVYLYRCLWFLCY